jgi:hypothetical protein
VKSDSEWVGTTVVLKMSGYGQESSEWRIWIEMRKKSMSE